MDTFLGLPTDAWSALAAWASVLVLIITGRLIYGQVREARKLREAQERPFVVVGYEFNSFLIYITIRNIGRTVARNVCIAFNKELQTTVEGRSTELHNLYLLKNGLKTFVPGQEIRILLDSFPDRVEAGLPMEYIATARYETHDGKRLDPEEYFLDLGPYMDTAVPDKNLDDLVREVQEIRKSVAKWGRTGGGGGLLVWARDEDRQVKLRERPIRIRRARRVLQDDGLSAFGRHVLDRFRQRHSLHSGT